MRKSACKRARAKAHAKGHMQRYMQKGTAFFAVPLLSLLKTPYGLSSVAKLPYLR